MANQLEAVSPLQQDQLDLFQPLKKYVGTIKLFDASKNRLAARDAINKLEEVAKVPTAHILKQTKGVVSKLDELGILLKALPTDTAPYDRLTVKRNVRFYTSIFLQLKDMYLDSRQGSDSPDDLVDFPTTPDYPDCQQELKDLTSARKQVTWEVSSWVFTSLPTPSLNSTTTTDRWAQSQNLQQYIDSVVPKWASVFIHGPAEVGNLRRRTDPSIPRRLDQAFAKLFFPWLSQRAKQREAEYSLLDLVLIVADLGGYFKVEEKGLWQVVSARLGLDIDLDPQINWIACRKICEAYQTVIRDFEPCWRSAFGITEPCVVPNTTPASTSLVTKAGRKPVRRSSKFSRFGMLSGFMSLPVEMLGEVVQHLAPIDLLHMSRTSKRLRALLLSNKAWWIRSIKELPHGFPEFPKGISQLELISLCFDSACQMCDGNCPPLSRKTSASFFGHDFELIRSCSFNCCQRWLCDSGYQGFVHDVGPSMAHLFSLITSFEPTQSARKKDWNVAYASLVSRKFFKACTQSTTRFMDFLEAWNPASTSKLISQLYAWKERMRQAAKDKLLESHENRWMSIRQKLIELGHEEKDFPTNSFRWKEITRQARPLTALIWTRIQPQLEQIIARNKPSQTTTTATITEVIVVDDVEDFNEDTPMLD